MFFDGTDPEEEGNTLVQNVWKYLPVNHPKILETERIFVFTTRHLAFNIVTEGYNTLWPTGTATRTNWVYVGKRLRKRSFWRPTK